MAHQDQGLGKKQWQKETFNNWGVRGGKVHCRQGGGQGVLPSEEGQVGKGQVSREAVSVGRGWGKGDGQHWPWPKAAGTHAQGSAELQETGERRPSSHVACRTPQGRRQGWGLHPPSPRLPGGWLAWPSPSSHHRPHKGWRHPPPENRAGDGWPGLTHLPSSGFHTRCRQRTWS